MTLSDPGLFGSPLVFEGLRPHTTYVLQGEALDAGGNVISVPDQSRTVVDVGADDRPSPVALGIQLADQAFSGVARLPPVALVPGAVRPALRGVVSAFAGEASALAFAGRLRLGVECNITVDRGGNLVVAETAHHVVRLVAPDGAIQTIAGPDLYDMGFRDGVGSAARFSFPCAPVVAADGAVFVVDRGNHCVRRIAPTGEVTTVAGDGVSGYVDGPAAQARFNAPEGLALTASGTLLVADTGNHRIRVVSAAGVVSTLAGSGSKAFGNGEGLAASFNTPVGLALDALGTLYVADSGNHRIRAVSPAGAVSTWAGTGVAGTTDGAAGSARFNSPRDLAFEADGSLLVLDHNSQRLRRVSTAGVVTTVAGGAPGFADGPAGTFHRPRGLATGVDGTIYVCDYSGLRAVVAQRVVTLVPNGVGSRDGARAVARFNHPYGLALAPNGDLYVSEEINHRIRAISPTGEVRTVAGSTAGFQDGSGGSASFNAPAGLAFGPDGSLVVADRVNNRIRMVSPTGGVSTLAGAAAGYADGTGAAAQFNRPIGVAVDASGRVYVADAGNHRIRVITAAGVVTTLAGSGAAGTADGPPASAAFNSPQALLLLPDGGLIVAEGGSHRIRRVTPEGAVSTLAGSTQGAADGLGPEAAFANPSGLALEPSGSIIVSDGWGQRLRRVTPEGRVTTLAGSVAGHMDGAGATALFDHPRGLAIAPDGSLFVAERNGHVIRVVR